MSVQAMSWVLEHSESRLGARCVLLSIANHADREGRNAWPSVKTIAIESRLGEREVQYAVKTLKQLGELEVTPGGGRGRPNTYRLPLMGGKLASNAALAEGLPVSTAPTEQRNGAKFAPFAQQKGARAGPKGCTGPPERVHTGAPEPSNSEPSTTEPSKTFCVFWDVYPRKIGKAKAEKLWQKMSEEQKTSAISGLKLWKQAEQWNRDGGKYIPHGNTFLEQKRYLDEPWAGAFSEVA
jgi:hypothetical protein